MSFIDVIIRLIFVNMQHIYVDMHHNYNLCMLREREREREKEREKIKIMFSSIQVCNFVSILRFSCSEVFAFKRKSDSFNGKSQCLRFAHCCNLSQDICV